MGEMADYINEEWGEEDSEYQEYDGPPLRLKICKYCGAGHLYWQNTKDGWRLYNNKGIHICEL